LRAAFLWVIRGLVLIVPVFMAACSSDAETLFKRHDYAEAMVQWHKRAEGGDAVAQNYLGIHYQLGLGVPQDLKEAFNWYQKAADNGNADAQRNLGTMYYDGHGVPQDDGWAYAWYYVSAKNGNTKAKEAMLAMGNEITPNKTRIMEGKVRAYLADKPGAFKDAGSGSSEYERVIEEPVDGNESVTP